MTTPLAFAGDEAGYLTPVQAAAYLPETARQIRDLCATGQIVAQVRTFASGRVRYKIHRSSIDKYLQAHRTGRIAA